MKNHIEPCPWCNSSHEVLQIDEVQPSVWAVCCPECGAIGPHPADRHQCIAEAVDRWNGCVDHKQALAVAFNDVFGTLPDHPTVVEAR